MKLILVSLLFSFSTLSTPPLPSALLREFIRDLANKSLSNGEIEEKYLCTQMLHRDDACGEKARSIAGFYLSALRQGVDEQRINTDELVFMPFDELPDEHQTIVGGTRYAYAARRNGKTFCYFLIEGDKIASFVLINQGGRAYFMSFCQQPISPCSP